MSEKKDEPATPPESSEEPKEEKGEESGKDQAEAPPASARQRSTTFWILLLFILVSQPLLLIVVIVPYWWAPLPILAVWGVIGWRRSWVWAFLAGLLLGLGFWAAQLLALPAGPRAKLAVIIASGIGPNVPAYLAYVLGPLLFGLLAGLAALTVTAGLRLWDDIRPKAPAPASPVASDA